MVERGGSGYLRWEEPFQIDNCLWREERVCKQNAGFPPFTLTVTAREGIRSILTQSVELQSSSTHYFLVLGKHIYEINLLSASRFFNT